MPSGGFDSLFIADVLGAYDVYQGSADAAVTDGVQVPVNDPLLLVSAMAVTSHLGFGVTVSSTYEQPYALARKFGPLDHLSKGRVGWNIVTSYLDSAARNMGRDRQVPHDERYQAAEEFLEVCYKLRESSWEDGAVVRDKARGVFADPGKVHPIGHQGRYFSVPGVFLCEPSPQRTPLLFQAGASASGLAFAARHAEAVFFIEPRPELLRPKVARLRELAKGQGRDPRSLKVFPLMTVVTAATDAEARAKLADYQRYASYDGARALYGGWTGLDRSGYDPDRPLRYADTDAMRSALETFTTADPAWECGRPGRSPASWASAGGPGAAARGSPRCPVPEEPGLTGARRNRGRFRPPERAVAGQAPWAPIRWPTPKVTATARPPKATWRNPERRTGRPVSRPTAIPPTVSATAVSARVAAR